MNKAEKERVIFLEFVPVSDLNVDLTSVENRSPPEPDIVCDISGRGTVGFELTELIDQGFMARRGLLGRTQLHLRESRKSGFSAAESSEFRRKYNNALLDFVYREGATPRKREEITGPVLQVLLRLADEFEGTLSGIAEFGSVLDEIRISRGEFQGPILGVDSSGRLGDPTVGACIKKFKKTYECDYPIELLAYVEFDLLPPQDAWTAAIEELADNFAASQFERVWVFDRASKSIKFELPLRER